MKYLVLYVGFLWWRLSHPFNGPFSRTTWVGRYQKDQTACYHRHSEVWSLSWPDTARALARRSPPSSLQASSDSSPVSEIHSERPRTTVSVGALHPGLQCWHAPASAYRQPSPTCTCRTAFPAQHLRPSGVLSCWPDGLELTPGFYPESIEQHRLF